MIKNIVFDMGKVLLDYEPLLVCDQYTDSEEEKQLIGKALFSAPEWELLDRGAITEEQALIEMKKRLPDERLFEMAKGCLEHWHEFNLIPKEGMGDLVRALKNAGLKIYLCSNASLRLRAFEHLIPGIECFDGVLVSAEEKCLKPEPEIYRRLFDKFGILPEESFFIDDLIVNIEGGRACGMDGYCFADGDVEQLKAYLWEMLADDWVLS